MLCVLSSLVCDACQCLHYYRDFASLFSLAAFKFPFFYSMILLPPHGSKNGALLHFFTHSLTLFLLSSYFTVSRITSHRPFYRVSCVCRVIKYMDFRLIDILDHELCSNGMRGWKTLFVWMRFLCFCVRNSKRRERESSSHQNFSDVFLQRCARFSLEFPLSALTMTVDDCQPSHTNHYPWRKILSLTADNDGISHCSIESRPSAAQQVEIIFSKFAFYQFSAIHRQKQTNFFSVVLTEW